jgi:hypothetical protein
MASTDKKRRARKHITGVQQIRMFPYGYTNITACKLLRVNLSQGNSIWQKFRLTGFRAQAC